MPHVLGLWESQAHSDTCAELKQLIELRLAKGTSVVATCSENILITENIGSKQSIKGTKSSEPGLGTHLHLFLFCRECHLVLP